MLLAVLALGGGIMRADEGSFTQQLSPAEMHRAGLDKLTPEERAELDLLVAKGTKTVVKEVVRTVTVVQEAEPTPKAVAARASESKSAAEGGGWLNWLKPKPAAEKAKVPVPVIESQIPGKLRGWGPHTVFTLANGQMWAVSDYSTQNLIHPLDSPSVKITPVSIFGYDMDILGTDLRVRVRPVN